MEQTFSLPDGRQLGYCIVGEGKPVLYFHGTASSRLETLLLKEEDLKQEEKPLVSEDEIEADQSPKKKNKFWPFGKKNKKSKESELEEEY